MSAFELVFERKLHLQHEREITTAVLRIITSSSTSTNEKDFFVCSWSFEELHPEIGKIYGLDPLDAFLNCVEFIRQLIQKHKSLGYTIWWHEEGDDGGLILAGNAAEVNYTRQP